MEDVCKYKQRLLLVYVSPDPDLCVWGDIYTWAVEGFKNIAVVTHVVSNCFHLFGLFLFFLFFVAFFFSKCSRGIYISFWRKADLIKDYAATVQWRLKSPHDVSLETINPSVAPMTVIKYELHMSY